MATRIIDDSKLNDIAVAIQEKDNGGQMTVDDMPDRIDALPTGGTLIPKTITENGFYNATDDNADGYDVVTVDVPEKNTLYEYMKNTLETANLGDITEIPANFFRSKTSLINVTMPSVTTIGNNAFQNCTNLLNAIMPNVTNMGNTAFQSCTNLALTSLPSGVTNTGAFTFQNCENLALTSLPSGVTTIGGNCFSRCTKLALTSLPNSVTSIDSGAFQYCTGIQYLDFSEFTTIPTLGTNVFLNTTFPLYFRDQQQLDEWAVATNWSTYAGRFQIKPSEVI